MDKTRFSLYIFLVIAVVLSAMNLIIFLTGKDKSESILLSKTVDEGPTPKWNKSDSISFGSVKGLEELNSKVIYLEERIIEIGKKENIPEKQREEKGNKKVNPNLLSKPDCVLEKDDFNSIISGTGYENVIQTFGKPQKEFTYRNGTIQMYYYKKGMNIFVDRWGTIDRIEFYGKPRSDSRTASGRWANVYDEKGEWYEPNKWVIDRVGIGTHTKDVYIMWGKPTRRELTADGREYLLYADRKIRLEIDRDYFVINIGYDKDIE